MEASRSAIGMSAAPAGAGRAQPRSVLSPLRYPGGKRRLVPYVAAALHASGTRPDLLVEAYAGGASVALELAATDAVGQIALGDDDQLVADFWHETMFGDLEWLCWQIETVTVDLACWQRLKRDPGDERRDRALACLLLNRTSFNGSLHRHAGPIGGKTGSSRYAIDCRLPRERLARRLRMCRALADAGKVAWVAKADGVASIARARAETAGDDRSVFFYLDPPFYGKSRELYARRFEPADHRRLAAALRFVAEPFLLSYDDAPLIIRLYQPHKGRLIERVELLYTGTQRSAGTEIVVTNLPHLPENGRCWRTREEWKAQGLRPGSPVASGTHRTRPSEERR